VAKRKKKWGGARESAFTDVEVRKIRRLYADGKKVAEIATRLGARYDTITRVVKGYSYKHVEDAPAKPEPAYAPTADKDISVLVKAGDRVRDCDPRKERTGVVAVIGRKEDLGIDVADIEWNTGKLTTVKLSAIHRKGYRIVGTLPTTIAEVAREVLADPAPVTDATATAA